MTDETLIKIYSAFDIAEQERELASVAWQKEKGRAAHLDVPNRSGHGILGKFRAWEKLAANPRMTSPRGLREGSQGASPIPRLTPRFCDF